jgi:hypothetical protein
MSLAAAEFIMDVEETFRIRFEDSELEQFTTFGQFRSAIARKLGQRRSGACLSSAVFYRMRRALSTQFGIARGRVVPSAMVEDLLPRQERRRNWVAFGQELGNFRLPQLRRPVWIMVNLLAVSWGLIITGIVLGMINAQSLPPSWLLVLGAIASGFLGCLITKPFGVSALSAIT